jgi:transcriptional regulator with XRE-family HTH domain
MSDRSVARNLRVLRLQSGLTQKELAKACGLSESTISAAESGSRNTRFPTILQICRGLGVSPDDLGAEAQARASHPLAGRDNEAQFDELLDAYLTSQRNLWRFLFQAREKPAPWPVDGGPENGDGARRSRARVRRGRKS